MTTIVTWIRYAFNQSTLQMYIDRGSVTFSITLFQWEELIILKDIHFSSNYDLRFPAYAGH